MILKFETTKISPTTSLPPWAEWKDFERKTKNKLLWNVNTIRNINKNPISGSSSMRHIARIFIFWFVFEHSVNFRMFWIDKSSIVKDLLVRSESRLRVYRPSVLVRETQTSSILVSRYFDDLSPHIISVTPFYPSRIITNNFINKSE